MVTQNSITLAERLTAPTPKFFKTLRTVVLSLAGVATAIIAAPVALPAIVTTVAGYVIAAGTVAGAVSSLPVDFDKLAKQKQ